MSLPVLLARLWALAAGVAALLPVRRQLWPVMLLLPGGAALALWIAAAHGWPWLIPPALALLSVMRNPLRFACGWAGAVLRGRTPPPLPR
ncbi:uncharacterized protein DUF2484 [Hasllibacter halocynthiae]|uniref:Uncharacterized protein DUF2484 n=1 Tax=Hasllibacter halocynthiae TaxID=595589 RepID=A0A2T0X9G0_9RHOB|nr:DUF2484 family protein [Hasllibacter halocynthiae]PRY95576.1 uncharacterized protein DUF2484 [Hasllibacter halocynthiae]